MTLMLPASLQSELDRFAEAGRRHSRRLSTDYQHLWRSLIGVTDGGKRFRSRLLLATYASYGGRDDAVATRVAAAVELLHAALIIHDDVIDNDLVRRGTTNVSGAFVDRAMARGTSAEGAATLGLTAGVLAGDLALVAACRGFALCGAEPGVTRRLLDLLDDAVRITAAGELDDVVMSMGGPSSAALNGILLMEEQKTAAYSFQLPLQAGAALAGAPQPVVEQLAMVGRHAGIGYQLVDDLRGVFGDEAETGKSCLGDLREGKRTALIAHAQSTARWPEIEPLVGDPTLDVERAALVRAVLEECGSRVFVERLVGDYLSTALRIGEQAGLEPELLAELASLTDSIVRSAA
jgi:geranylgeranyl diphosphate synthase type II